MQKKIRFYLTLNGTSNWSHMFPFHFKMLKVLNAISQRSIFCLLLLTELIILECRPKFDVMTVQSIPIHLSSMIWILEIFYMITRLSTLTDWVTVWIMAIDKIILINTFQWYRRKIRLLSLPRSSLMSIIATLVKLPFWFKYYWILEGNSEDHLKLFLMGIKPWRMH